MRPSQPQRLPESKGLEYKSKLITLQREDNESDAELEALMENMSQTKHSSLL